MWSFTGDQPGRESRENQDLDHQHRWLQPSPHASRISFPFIPLKNPSKEEAWPPSLGFRGMAWGQSRVGRPCTGKCEKCWGERVVQEIFQKKNWKNFPLKKNKYFLLSWFGRQRKQGRLRKVTMTYYSGKGWNLSPKAPVYVCLASLKKKKNQPPRVFGITWQPPEMIWSKTKSWEGEMSQTVFLTFDYTPNPTPFGNNEHAEGAEGVRRTSGCRFLNGIQIRSEGNDKKAIHVPRVLSVRRRHLPGGSSIKWRDGKGSRRIAEHQMRIFELKSELLCIQGSRMGPFASRKGIRLKP